MNTHPSRGRLALVISSVALVTSVAFSAGPVMARSLINADKVDGLSAVRAGTSADQRRGMLVATRRSTGKLPNDLIDRAPNAAKLGGLPPSAFGGTYLPPFPTSPNPYPASLSLQGATFTTPVRGYAYLQSAASLTMGCPDDNTIIEVWLTVDGKNVGSSRQFLLHPDQDAAINVTLAGVTASPLSAGDHSFTVEAGCGVGMYTTYLELGTQPGHVVVLPSTYHP